MNKANDIVIIDREEAEILVKALFPYMMDKVKTEHKDIRTQVVVDLYNDLKGFVNED